MMLKIKRRTRMKIRKNEKKMTKKMMLRMIMMKVKMRTRMKIRKNEKKMRR